MSDLPNGGAAADAEDIDLGVTDEIEEPLEEEADLQPEEPAEQPDQQTEQPRRQSRRDVLAELRENTRRMERELAELRTQRQAPPQPAYDPYAAQRADQEFLAQLQQMDPYQAAIAIRDRERQQMGMALQQVERNMSDRIDRQSFSALTASDAEARRLAPEVERLVSEARRGGDFVTTRQTVYELLYGR